MELLRGGEVIAREAVEGNFQRLCRVWFDGVECDAVRVHVHATNGVKEARVFEVRVYA